MLYVERAIFFIMNVLRNDETKLSLRHVTTLMCQVHFAEIHYYKLSSQMIVSLNIIHI